MSIKQSLEDTADKAKRAIHDTAENAKDTLNEVTHSGKAGAERARRDVAGDDMEPADYVRSVADEAKNKIQADISSTKRDLRNNTK
jgi:hypothetical protein